MEVSLQKYEERIRELFSKHPTVQTDGFSSGAYKAGLEGMTALDAEEGHPWKKYRCIHVAGTNGKGSVSSMVAALLNANGFKVGLYTSPHLLDFRERIKLIENGESHLIPRSDVWEFLEAFEKDSLSFFEISTGMAFWWFERQKVDYAVIEVGLGGRLDSTNIITPELSIITSIGLDHCTMLGDTTEKIAAEKAGIIKPGVKALIGYADEGTKAVFESVAAAKASPLTFAQDFPFPELECDLEGDYQKENIRTSCTAMKLLEKTVYPDAIRHVAAITDFHGRWERLCTNPEVICDIGHNPAALERNFSQLKALGRPLVIVYGVMADKDADSIIRLMPSSARYVITAPHTSRAMDTVTLLKKMRSLRPELDVHSSENAKDAVATALRLASEDSRSLIYIGGSAYVVAECIPEFSASI